MLNLCQMLEVVFTWRAMKAYRFPIRAQSRYSLAKLKLTQQTELPKLNKKNLWKYRGR